MAIRGFGKVTVTTPGTPVKLTSTITPALAAGVPVQLQSVLIEALPGNAGLVYVFAQADGSNHRTDLVGCAAILPKPTSATTGPFPSVSFGIPAVPAGINLANLWIDADTGGDGVVVSGVVQ